MTTRGTIERLVTTRLVMRLFIASVAVNAVLGILALLSGDFGDLEGRILATSFLVSALMLGVLVHVPAIGRRALWPVPLVGAVAAVLGLALVIVLVWVDPAEGPWVRIAGSFLVVAAGAALAANLALIGLARRYGMVRSATIACIAALVVLILFAIWGNPDGDWFPRIVGVVSILVAAGTLLIPALARFAPPGDEPPEADSAAGVEVDEAAVRFCPSCGQSLPTRPLGSATTCTRCGLTFEVLEAVTAADPGGPRPAG